MAARVFVVSPLGSTVKSNDVSLGHAIATFSRACGFYLSFPFLCVFPRDYRGNRVTELDR